MERKDFDRDKFMLETWPQALESGEFSQGKHELHDEIENTYCCLGVACELLTSMRLLMRSDWIGDAELPRKAIEILGIEANGDHKRGYGSLANDNDGMMTFKQIARRIRSVHKRNDWDPVLPVA